MENAARVILKWACWKVLLTQAKGYTFWKAKTTILPNFLQLLLLLPHPFYYYNRNVLHHLLGE
jgi:hypothetical protein